MSEWCWGIDVAVGHLAFGFVQIDGRDHQPYRWNSVQIPKEPDLGERLLHHQARTESFVAAIREHFPPVAVVLELPTGRFPSPPLAGAWAATLMGLRRQLPQPYLLASDITPPMWKKGVGLKGNAGKEDVLAHAQAAYGYSGDSQDQADALCMAAYCAIQITRPRALAA